MNEEGKFLVFGDAVIKKESITALHRGYKEAQLVGDSSYFTVTIFTGTVPFTELYSTEEERDAAFESIYSELA